MWLEHMPVFGTPRPEQWGEGPGPEPEGGYRGLKENDRGPRRQWEPGGNGLGMPLGCDSDPEEVTGKHRT